MRRRVTCHVLVCVPVLLCCVGCVTAPAPNPPAAQASSAPVGEPTPELSVPDVTGLRLADAQARLSAHGYPTVEAIDSTGQGRAVLDPANWIVQSQSLAAGTRGALGAAITLRVRKTTDTAGAPSNSRGVIPDVVCRDLQTAQDAMQAAGFSNLTSRDATGHNRAQVVDRNWVVVAQSVAAGGTPDPTTRILLSAVKLGEPTAASGCPS
jgi:beta-lactam-binding protein with PASTA domain